MIWVEPYERMVNPASSSNFSTNTTAEAGGLNETKQKTSWDTLHSNMYSDFQEVIFKITNFALSLTSTLTN